LRQKELRLALVCFGGVSLAVYMHGISKEILKLVRASKLLHEITNRNDRATAVHPDSEGAETSTEALYFELLRDIGREIELRVIVDTIAGASAGGINGVLLARALAHDLSLEPLRDLWLEQADVDELLAADSRATRFSKWFMRPVLWLAGSLGLIRLSADREVQEKISLFVRSRWFSPPFGGERMSAMLHDALQQMGHADLAGPSLIPPDQPLELYVPVTDFYGWHQDIALHDPPMVGERDHRHHLRFTYLRDHDGRVTSDFTDDAVPALTFAARATSSFPGAFPPAQLSEIDRVLARRGESWEGRERFLERNFEVYREAGMDPAATSFIDGSVLNNKPFAKALRSIDGRPAFRQVDRRLLYIDPDPIRPPPPPSGRRPGFFSTLKAALSDIPRSEPIGNELLRVNEHNENVQRQRIIIDSARPYIAKLVGEATQIDTGGPLTPEHVAMWRETASSLAAEEAGYAYDAYARLKLQSAVLSISAVIGQLAGRGQREQERVWFTRVGRVWASVKGIVPIEGGSLLTTAADGSKPWIAALQAYDIAFRQRRLRFLIQGQNQLYERLERAEYAGMSVELVDWMKRRFYDQLAHLRRRDAPDFYSTEVRALTKSLFTAEAMRRSPEEFVARRGRRLDQLLGLMAEEMNLEGTTAELDRLIAATDPKDWAPQARHELLLNYVGFPFWDVMTFSITKWRDLGEFDEIRIDRISPVDARSLRPGEAASLLKGVALSHFGAFFSRAYRENDYLWGRLHGVERMIDIVIDAAGSGFTGGQEAITALKRRAFRTVLKAEAPHLGRIAELIAELETELHAQEAREQRLKGGR
jgi:patatin-related protein